MKVSKSANNFYLQRFAVGTYFCFGPVAFLSLLLYVNSIRMLMAWVQTLAFEWLTNNYSFGTWLLERRGVNSGSCSMGLWRIGIWGVPACRVVKCLRRGLESSAWRFDLSGTLQQMAALSRRVLHDAAFYRFNSVLFGSHQVCLPRIYR